MDHRRGVERARVVRLRTARAGSGGARYRFGSGYVIDNNLVLTAAHVLVPPDRSSFQLDQTCEVLEWGRDDGAWTPGQVAAAEGRSDLALVAVPGLTTDIGPVSLGRLVAQHVVHWDAVGFPIAGFNDYGRQPEHAWGRVSPITGEFGGRLGLTLESRDALPAAAGTSGWAGLSGASVVVGGHVVGVVVADPPTFTGSLTGERIDALISNSALAEAAGHPTVVDLAPTPEPLILPARSPGSGPVVLIVDDEDAGVMRNQLSDFECVTASTVEEAIDLVTAHGSRIDAALVDLCLGEPTGVSGREVLIALREHRPHVPRAVVSFDPLIGVAGDVARAIAPYGVFATLRKSGPGKPVPDLRVTITAMLDQDDGAIRRIVLNEIQYLGRQQRRHFAAEAARRRLQRSRGEIRESDLAVAEERVQAVDDAIAAAESAVDTLSDQDRWMALDVLRVELEKLAMS